MATYLISTHGDPDYSKFTTIPANMSVRFYQQFGKPMDNNVGLLLQSALANPGHPNATNVMQQYPQKALWNAGSQKPEINLTGDDHHFYSGIVCADTNTVISAIGKHQLITLSAVLKQINDHAAGATPVIVHCLFCL